MGLSGRKVKQKIGHDPRNLTWADDASKFGTAYLQKLGWSAGAGLGSSGEGRTTHIKVYHKLDMLGIGAAHQKDPNGIAWKQNRDFENLLKRLNDADGSKETDSGTKVDGFVGAGTKEDETAGGRAVPEREEKERKKSKKRRKVEGDEIADEEVSRRKKRKDKEAEVYKPDQNDSQDSSGREENVSEVATVVSSGESTFVPTPKLPISRHPHRAHRARFIASKRLALASSTAMDEILGISRSGTSTPYPATSVPDTPSEPVVVLGLQELTTSSKSVMDYFKEKLQAKSSAKVALTSPTNSPRTADLDRCSSGDERSIDISNFRGGLGSKAQPTFRNDEEDVPRSGLGSSRTTTMFSALGFSASTSQISPVRKPSGQVESEDSIVANQDEPKVGPRKKKEKKSRTRPQNLEQADAEEDAASTFEQTISKKGGGSRKASRREESRSGGSDPVGEIAEDGKSKSRRRKG